MPHIGCKHLDYDEDKYTQCEIIELPDGVKYWKRPLYDPKGYPDQPTKVQFCKLRGRINFIYPCINPGEMYCYEAQDKEVAYD